MKKATRNVSRLLTVLMLAALISPAFQVKQAEAATISIQNQSPLVSFNGPTVVNLSVFFEKIFNLGKWLSTDGNNPDKSTPPTNKDDGKDKEKQDKDKQDKEKQDKDKQEKEKQDKDKKDKDKQDKDKQNKDKQYDAITKEATQQLIHLRNESKSELMRIAIQAKGVKDPKERSSLISKGQSTFAEKEAEFNAIIAAVTDKLQSQGFSTKIVDQYQAEFNQEVELGKNLLKNLIK
jgi:hypothetical protein